MRKVHGGHSSSQWQVWVTVERGVGEREEGEGGREREMKGNRGKKGKRGEMINTRLQVHNSSV